MMTSAINVKGELQKLIIHELAHLVNFRDELFRNGAFIMPSGFRKGFPNFL